MAEDKDGGEGGQEGKRQMKMAERVELRAAGAAYRGAAALNTGLDSVDKNLPALPL